MQESFCCRNNSLTTLLGSPYTVNGDFDCSINQLSSLSYAPVHVASDFDCSWNDISSLHGAPKTVYGDFTCEACAITFVMQDVQRASNVLGQIFC